MIIICSYRNYKPGDKTEILYDGKGNLNPIPAIIIKTATKEEYLAQFSHEINESTRLAVKDLDSKYYYASVD